MKAIDFRFRPNTPDAVDGLIHSPFFGDMKSPGSSPGATSKRPMAAPVPIWASWK